MRIAQLCPYSLSVPGGVQMQVLGLARAQRALGHDVVVLAPSDGPPPDAGVRVVGRSVSVVANGSVANVAVGIVAARRALAELSQESFDILHLHEPLVPGPTLASLLAHPAPCVGTFHRSGHSRAYSVLGPLARQAARKLDLRCAVSDEARSTAVGALGGSYDLLYNGIEIDRLANAVPWPTQAPTIMFLGRHEPRKGLSVCLDAFKRLTDSGVQAHLWVAGHGPQTEPLRRQYASLAGVQWLGEVDEREKVSRLKGADVLCAPSLGGESFGVILLEAMAAHTAIVASDLVAYRRVVEHGKEGLLVAPGDDRALEAALAEVISQPTLSESLASAGEHRAKAFSMSHLAELYIQRYTRLTGNARSSSR